MASATAVGAGCSRGGSLLRSYGPQTSAGGGEESSSKEAIRWRWTKGARRIVHDPDPHVYDFQRSAGTKAAIVIGIHD